MHSSILRVALVSILVVVAAIAERLENVRQVPATIPHHPTAPPFATSQIPQQSVLGIADYKNVYKGSAAAASIRTPPSASPLLHKSFQAPQTTFNSNAEQHHHDVVPIVKQTFEPNSGDGAYAYSYETANGISASEYGAYKAGPTGEDGIQSASGSYSYTGPDNIVYTITYTAGLEGFVPQGSHLPTPPPIPEAIQKVLQYANAGENSKYQPYSDTKYQLYSDNKYQTYGAESKQHSYGDETGTTSNKYTSALQTPYVKPTRPNYSKLAAYNNNDYKIQDD